MQSPNPESARNINFAVQQEKQNILRQIDGIEHCSNQYCGGGTRGSGPYIPPPATNGQTSNAPAVRGTCADWTRTYTAPGAAPPIRYQVGFNQAVAKCLEEQCTIQSLAAAVWAASFAKVRAVLAVAAAANFIDAVVHPPGYSPNPDPYLRGHEEGSRLCNWVLKLAIPANARRGYPLTGPNGKISIPKRFSFQKAVSTMRDWVPKMNPGRSKYNCGVCTANWVRAMFGQMLKSAPEVSENRAWTLQDMEADLGGRFSSMPLTDSQLAGILKRAPDGTVGVIGAQDPNGRMGHFFGVVKHNGQIQLVDPQNGGGEPSTPANWFYHWMDVGNAANL